MAHSPRMPIQVCVEDFSERFDGGSRRVVSTHETHASALTAARDRVEDGIVEFWRPGMSPEDFIRQWSMFGEDVFLVPDDGEPRFSAMEYARERIQELAGA